MMQSRLDKLYKIAQSAGILTNLVKNKLNIQDQDTFKQKFLSLPPGPARAQLVWNEAIKQGPPKNLVPVTATTSDGTQIKYFVMPDMIMSSDGIRLPLTAEQFQKLADMWGMHLPTNKMVQQIYDQSDAKIFAPPLSAGATINGKWYSGAEIVANKISDSDSKVAYDNLLNKELDNLNGKYTLVGGHQKEITSPILDPKHLNAFGWYFKGKPIQSFKQTAHMANDETEYGQGARLVGNNVIITKPDGSTFNTDLQTVMNDPTLFSAISAIQGIKKYQT